MFHAPVPDANMVTGRIEYVEVRGVVIIVCPRLFIQWMCTEYLLLLGAAYNLVEDTDK